MQIVGTTSIATFLIISLINLTFAPHVFSNGLFYCWRHLSLCNAMPLTHSLFLSLRCLALFPSSPIWYRNSGNHFQVIIDRNKLFWYTSLFHLEAAHNSTSHWNCISSTFTSESARLFNSKFRVPQMWTLFSCATETNYLQCFRSFKWIKSFLHMLSCCFSGFHSKL